MEMASIFRLDYCGVDNGPFFKIKDLLGLNYHDKCNIKNNVRLEVNDDDTCITFDKIEDLKQFIEEYEIIVSCQKLHEKIKEYDESSEFIKKFIKKFNG